jgi:hypothetical protein
MSSDEFEPNRSAAETNEDATAGDDVEAHRYDEDSDDDDFDD